MDDNKDDCLVICPMHLLRLAHLWPRLKGFWRATFRLHWKPPLVGAFVATPEGVLEGRLQIAPELEWATVKSEALVFMADIGSLRITMVFDHYRGLDRSNTTLIPNT